jgi:septal ring factor EnvC (AmiA/AmiB activator)
MIALIASTAILAGTTGLGVWKWIEKGSALTHMTGERDKLQVKLDAANRDLTQCRSNNANLTSSVSRQNAAVAELNTQLKAMQAQRDEALRRAATAGAKHDALAAQLSAFRATSTDACMAANELFNFAIEGRAH